jgi:hypothetical protein
MFTRPRLGGAGSLREGWSVVEGKLAAAAVTVAAAAAVAVAAVALLDPSDNEALLPVPPAAQTLTPTAPSGRPSLDRQIPTPALVRLRAAVHQLTEPVPGRPAALRARVVHYQVDSWQSSDDFTLLVTLDLHFPPQAGVAWNEGMNGRFVQFGRESKTQTYRLGWATSP